MAAQKTVSELIEEVSHRKPETTHKLVYESYAESLEPVYYFVLDLMNDFRLNPEKLIDNFTATPGSTQFAELGERASRMQQQASSILGNVNTVLRSVLNIVYDLKDFRLRLKTYDGLRSSDESVKKAEGSIKMVQYSTDAGMIIFSI